MLLFQRRFSLLEEFLMLSTTLKGSYMNSCALASKKADEWPHSFIVVARNTKIGTPSRDLLTKTHFRVQSATTSFCFIASKSVIYKLERKTTSGEHVVCDMTLKHSFRTHSAVSLLLSRDLHNNNIPAVLRDGCIRTKWYSTP